MIQNNSTLQCMRGHRSIRQFTQAKIPTETLTAILEAAHCASTSSFQQVVSIIRVTDPALRERIMQCCANQSYVGSAAEFLVFCADYNRHHCITKEAKLGYTEQLMTALVDAGLLAQNVLLAAEACELGGVFIGALRNQPEQVCALLQLPEYTFPLFGLCLGYPAQDPQSKPRLPLSVLLHENHYKPLSAQALEAYDQTIQAYYAARSGGDQPKTWSAQVREKLHKESRPFMAESLRRQGFLKR